MGRDKKGRGRRRRGKNRSSVRRSQHLPLLQGVETRTSVLPPSSLCLSGISLPPSSQRVIRLPQLYLVHSSEIEKVFDPTNRPQFYHSTERSFDRSIDHDRPPPLDGGGTAGMINIVIGKLVTLNSVRILSKACARSIDGVEDRFSPRVR